MNKQIGYFFIGISAIILFLIISIVILYVQKLIVVYKLSNGDEEYIAITTKSIILTGVCLSVTVIGYIPFAFVNHFNGYTYWIFEICLVFDLYANWICIVGGFAMFDHYYLKLCGTIDTKCRGCCGSLLKIDNKVYIVILNIIHIIEYCINIIYFKTLFFFGIVLLFICSMLIYFSNPRLIINYIQNYV